MKFLSDLKLFRAWRLLRAAYARYTFSILLIILINFLSGILEGVGINAIIPLFSFVGGQQHVPSDAISKFIQQTFGYFEIEYTATVLLILIAVLFALKALLSFLSRYVNLRIMASYEFETRGELFNLFLKSDWLHLKAQKVGFVDQVFLNDVGRSSGVLFHIGSLSVVLINIAVYGFLAVSISPVVASIALLFGIFILLLFKPFFSRYRMLSGVMLKKYKRFAHFLNEHIAGLKLIKASASEEGVLGKNNMLIDLLRRLRIRSEAVRILSDIVLQPLGVFFIIGVFAFLYKAGTFDFPSFAVIVYAVNRVFVNVQQIQSEVHDVNSRVPHVLAALNYKKEAEAHPEARGGDSPFVFKRLLELKGVHFEHGKHQILSDLTLSLSKGEMVGLIGPSGAGKTTFVDLILRLLPPTKGELILDGVPSTEIDLRQWRRNIGYVPQEPFLLNDTIANNIRFYDPSLSKEDIEKAAKLAHIHEFVLREPQGFETIVGERGMRLSGGERQRIALARALARKPQILVLDEATSALDNESEALIQESVKTLKGKMTLIVIAHRLSTVAYADRLVALEGGRIVEEGKPSELLKDKESYFSRVYKLS